MKIIHSVNKCQRPLKYVLEKKYKFWVLIKYISSIDSDVMSWFMINLTKGRGNEI